MTQFRVFYPPGRPFDFSTIQIAINHIYYTLFWGKSLIPKRKLVNHF